MIFATWRASSQSHRVVDAQKPTRLQHGLLCKCQLADQAVKDLKGKTVAVNGFSASDTSG